MARVTSQKTRQFIFGVDEAVDEGITPDRIALFLPDGTPINLTADPSKMKWMGDWSSGVAYILNDVVLDNDALYIATAETIASGEDPPSTPNADWELLFEAPSGGGYKGGWDIGTDYPVGSLVTYGGNPYGTTIEIDSGGVTPDFDPDSNFGAPIKGVQAKSSSKLDNEVPKTFDFLNAILDSGSKYGIPFALDFTAGWSDVTIRVQNDTDAMLQLFIDDAATGGSGTAGGTANAGATTDIAVNVDSWAGTSGEYVLLLNDFGGGARPVGTITLTVLAGANDLVPAPAGNPWVLLIEDFRPKLDTHASRLVSTPTKGRLWKETDTGLIYMGNGGSWDIYKSDGLLRKTADFTLPQSDVTLDSPNSDVPQLSWPVEINEIWVVESLLRLQGVSTVADIKFDFALPAGATFEIQHGSNSAGVGPGGAVTVVSAVEIAMAVTAGITFARIVAYIYVAGTAGTAKLRAAQNTSTAENVKVLINSILIPRRLA